MKSLIINQANKKTAHDIWAGFIDCLSDTYVIHILLEQMIDNRDILWRILFLVNDLTRYMHNELAQPTMGWVMLQ